MYLLIGYENDPCCQIVHALLRQHGHEVYMTAELFTEDTFFRWTFDTTSSQSSLRLRDGRLLTDDAWRGVLVRGRSELTSSDEWKPDDLAYMREETQAALIAWLQGLPCPVINRFPAELWFRPYRPPVEWRSLFMRFGLPTLAIHVTNDMATAHQFANSWRGEVIYTPLTSSTRYYVASEQQWSQLAQLMDHFLVTLIEPYQGTTCYATLVGTEVIWSSHTPLDPKERKVVEVGLHQLTHTLQTDLIQIEMLVGNDGLRCTNIHLFPQFAIHTPKEQWKIGEAIVTLLTSNSKMEVAP